MDFESGGQHATITLYSKFTAIVGLYSNEGKSEFLNSVDTELKLKNCKITTSNGLKVRIPSDADVSLGNIPTERCIVLIDELGAFSADIIRIINNSPCIFIVTCRDLPTTGDYPLCGLYHIKRTDNWFKFSHVESLRLYTGQQAVNSIIAESAENRSEHELVSKYYSPITAAFGRDNLEKVIELQHDNVLVLADLGNIGRAYPILRKRCNEYSNVYFMTISHLKSCYMSRISSNLTT